MLLKHVIASKSSSPTCCIEVALYVVKQNIINVTVFMIHH